MKKIVIYFVGGTMSGVFGAGVASTFLKENLYSRVKAVYGTSAGAMTGAYFLARQLEGASIYWEDLNSNFIKSTTNFYIGAWQRFQNKFFRKIRPEKFREALDTNYLFNDVIKNKKKLNVRAVIDQEIPFYVKMFNLDTYQLEYIDVRRSDILNILRVSISVFPYMYELKATDGKRLIDAGIIEAIGADYLLNKYPNDVVIVVLNRKPETGMNYKIKNILEGKFMQWMFNDLKLYELHASAESKLQTDIAKIKKTDNALLVSLPKKIPIKSRTTSKKVLLKAYDAGIKEGYKLIRKLSL